MQKPMLCTITILLFSSAALRADQTQIDVISDLRNQAQDEKEKKITVRLGAIDKLGRIKPNDCESLLHLKEVYKDLLTKPVGDEYKNNLFFYHVANAVANLGPDAFDLVPSLNARKGLDRILDNAIEEAIKKILPAPLPPPPPRQPPPPQPKPADPIGSLVKTLADEKADVILRIIAARELGMLGKANLLANQKADAQKALRAVSEGANVDAILKCVAGEALKQIP